MYMRTALLCAALIAGQVYAADDDLKELSQLRRAVSAKKRETRKLIEEAHAALDHGEYERAVATHKQAAPGVKEAQDLEKTADALVVKFVAGKIAELNSDEFDVRERATSTLLVLRKTDAAIVRRLAEGREGEVRTRLLSAAQKLEESDEEEDDAGFLHQWAASARASTEYGNPDWGAVQATGKPDAQSGADSTKAWASSTINGVEWLELTYNKAISPTEIRVRETYNPGAVTKVEALDADRHWHTIWEGKDDAKEWLEIKISPPAWTIKTIKITIDNQIVGNWCEIDAAEVIGELKADK
jgi:hypothetical protein